MYNITTVHCNNQPLSWILFVDRVLFTIWPKLHCTDNKFKSPNGKHTKMPHAFPISRLGNQFQQRYFKTSWPGNTKNKVPVCIQMFCLQQLGTKSLAQKCSQAQDILWRWLALRDIWTNMRWTKVRSRSNYTGANQGFLVLLGFLYGPDRCMQVLIWLWNHKDGNDVGAVRKFCFIFISFIYSGCEPGIPGKANLITVLAKNPWREDNEGNISVLDVGEKP